MLPKGLVQRGFDHVDGREGGLATRLGMNNVGPVGSENTYWRFRAGVERWRSFLLNAWARRGARGRASIRDERRSAIDPVA